MRFFSSSRMKRSANSLPKTFLHSTKFCVNLCIPFWWSGIPASSQLVLCEILCVWRCISDASSERDILCVHLLCCHLIISSKIVFSVSLILVQDEKPMVRLWWKTQVGLWKGSSRLVKALRVEDSICPLCLIAWNLGNLHFLAFSLSQILLLDLLVLLWAAEKCLSCLIYCLRLIKKKKEQENEKKGWLGEREEMRKT